MNIFIIAIVMFFADPNRPAWLEDSVEIKTQDGVPLRFTTKEKCLTYVDTHLSKLTEFGKAQYPDAVTVKSIYCVERKVL